VGSRSPSLSAIVPATDAPPTLERCGEAIANAVDPPEETLFVERPVDGGPSAARNIGTRWARGDVLVFVDADVVPHPDAFARIRSAFAADPGLTAVFGAYDASPEAGGVVSAFRNLLPHHVHNQSAGPAGTFWSGLGAVRRDRFLSVDGFDSETFPGPGVEDVDLGMRLAERGDRLLLDPRIRCTHLKRWTLRDMVQTDLWRRGVPWIVLLLRRRRLSRELNLGYRHRLSAVACLSGALALGARRPSAAVASAATVLVLNRSFYALLWHRGGARVALAGVGLHWLHHLTALLAVPLGAFVYLRRLLATPQGCQNSSRRFASARIAGRRQRVEAERPPTEARAKRLSRRSRQGQGNNGRLTDAAVPQGPGLDSNQQPTDYEPVGQPNPRSFLSLSVSCLNPRHLGAILGSRSPHDPA
jgi:GT2 family glycosyltransferase